MQLFCIDPGTIVSGVVVIDTLTKELSSVYSEIDNEELLKKIPFTYSQVCDHLAIEMVASYGMPVGREVFETVVWIGRFMQAFDPQADRVTKIYRKDVKIALCGSYKAKDSNIRQALIDRYPADGGGRTPQVGTKNEPGPLSGVAKHAWSALAVGHTWLEQYEAPF
jgi:hypothetical protein